MKRIRIALALCCLLLLSACDFFSYDNVEPPKASLEGAVVYQGQPVPVRQGAVTLELWEPGFEERNPINVNVHQDGTIGALLFPGEYKLVISKDGPWVTNKDTLNLQVSGSTTTVEVPVTPYFDIQNAEFTFEGSTVHVTFDVARVVEGAELETVALYVNSARFVDWTGDGNIVGTSLVAADLEDWQNVELSLDLSKDQLNQLTAIFARVGVKAVGVPDWMFTQVWKHPLK